MKNSLTLALALIALAVFSGFGLAQERKVSPTQGAQKVGPDEEARRQAAEPVLTPPPMSRDDTAKLEAFRNQARVNACPGSFPVPIAVSVMGANHYSSGQDVLLNYPLPTPPRANEGGAWFGNSTFIAVCPGLYYFAVDFVKDTAYHGGTNDDVYIYIARNGSYLGAAWAGEMEPSQQYDRSTGAYHVILRLQLGDYIQTFVHSDGGVMRNIYNYNFSGHRIGN